MTSTIPQIAGLNTALKMVEQMGGKQAYFDLYKKRNTAIREGITNPMFIETHRLAEFNPRGTDVPVVLDLMIHDIDIILSVVNSEVKQINASGVSVISKSPDIANARIEFENGCVANVTASRASRETMRKMRIFQQDAYISIDFQSREIAIYKKKKGLTLIPGLPNVAVEKRSFGQGDPLKDEIDAFFRVQQIPRRYPEACSPIPSPVAPSGSCRHLDQHTEHLDGSGCEERNNFAREEADRSGPHTQSRVNTRIDQRDHGRGVASRF